MDSLNNLFSNAGFLPHGSCYTWDPVLIGLHVVSDGLIALAYFCIPLTLVYLVRRRKDLAFNWIFVCFAVFIVACGVTHIMEIWNIWHPRYWLAGMIKAVTALASVTTAAVAVRLIPRALTMPSVAELRAANQGLEQRTAELARANVTLEQFAVARQRAEENLGKREADLREAQRVAKLGSWEWTVEADVVTWSEELYRIFNRDANLPAPRYGELEALYLPESWARLQRVVERALHDGTPYEIDLELVPGQGRTQWIAAHGEPVRDAGGRIVGLRGTAQDVTALRRSEQQLRLLNANLEQRVQQRTVQLEAANRELEAFSYSVSHDLRAPLRSMDGFSRALLEGYSDKIDAQGRDSLQRVRAASQRMAQLIEDLLGLSKVTRSELQLGPVNLSELARSVSDELQAAEPQRRVSLVIEPDAVAARGDVHLLRIVLENLFGNAWKFVRKQAFPKIEFGATERDGEPVWYVRDNGAGFNMAYAHKLFGAFQRLHTAAEYPGTGIGLATVQRIIHRHGGRVWAEAAVGQGATFYFSLSSAHGRN